MFERLEEALRPEISRFSGRVSLALQSFEDSSTYALNANDRMHAASLIKLPILIEALAQVQQGQLSLTSRHSLQREDIVGGSGVLNALSPGLSLSLQDLLTLMIIVSDNTATNMVIDRVGIEAVNQRCETIGLQRTELIGKLQLLPEHYNERQRAGERNVSCAADMLKLLSSLQRGVLLSDQMTEVALRILRKQVYTEALGRYLPLDSELHEDAVRLGCKSGNIRGVWHDVGIIYSLSNKPLYAIAVMTADAQDLSESWEQEGMMLIARVSRMVFEEVQAQREA